MYFQVLKYSEVQSYNREVNQHQSIHKKVEKTLGCKFPKDWQSLKYKYLKLEQKFNQISRLLKTKLNKTIITTTLSSDTVPLTEIINMSTRQNERQIFRMIIVQRQINALLCLQSAWGRMNQQQNTFLNGNQPVCFNLGDCSGDLMSFLVGQNPPVTFKM